MFAVNIGNFDTELQPLLPNGGPVPSPVPPKLSRWTTGLRYITAKAFRCPDVLSYIYSFLPSQSLNPVTNKQLKERVINYYDPEVRDLAIKESIQTRWGKVLDLMPEGEERSSLLENLIKDVDNDPTHAEDSAISLFTELRAMLEPFPSRIDVNTFKRDLTKLLPSATTEEARSEAVDSDNATPLSHIEQFTKDFLLYIDVLEGKQASGNAAKTFAANDNMLALRVYDPTTSTSAVTDTGISQYFDLVDQLIENHRDDPQRVEKLLDRINLLGQFVIQNSPREPLYLSSLIQQVDDRLMKMCDNLSKDCQKIARRKVPRLPLADKIRLAWRGPIAVTFHVIFILSFIASLVFLIYKIFKDFVIPVSDCGLLEDSSLRWNSESMTYDSSLGLECPKKHYPWSSKAGYFAISCLTASILPYVLLFAVTIRLGTKW